jgi:hypothetical protein
MPRELLVYPDGTVQREVVVVEIGSYALIRLFLLIIKGWARQIKDGPVRISSVRKQTPRKAE